MYGSEICTPDDMVLNSLDLIQNKALRAIFGTVKGCAVSFMRILSGQSTIKSRWKYNRLKYFGKVLISCLNDQLPGKILIDEMNRCFNHQCKHTYAAEIVQLLNEFGLNEYCDLNKVIKLNKLSKWKSILKKAILDRNCEHDWQELQSKKTTNRCLQSMFRTKTKQYKRMDSIFNIIEKFKNRKGVKWYFRVLSGATPETWKLKKNKSVKCAFCGMTFEDFIEHLLTECRKLKSKRKKYNIKGDPCYILTGNNNNVSNLVKFLSCVFSDSKYNYV